jgi:DNA mismatch repair protein MutS
VPKPGPKQQSLFAPPPEPVVEELKALDLDVITPRQALELLAQWQARVRGKQ